MGMHMNVDSEIFVEIGGKSYLIASDDDYLEHIRNGFEPGLVQIFKSLVSENDTILDVGANIGCSAILFGELSKQVYAFEPSPTTFAFLEKNIKNSGLHNISLNNVGLGDKAGSFTLTFSPANRSGGFVSDRTRANADHTVENIQVTTMDDFVSKLGIACVNFIKIDVEGYEGHVLRGASETLGAFKPTVVLELNHWCLNAFQRTSIPDFFDYLRSIFPILLAIDSSGYLNLHDQDESYTVMYNHIINMRFQNIVAAFDENRLDRFRALKQHL